MDELFVGLRIDGTPIVLLVEAGGMPREICMSHRSPRFPSAHWEWGYGGAGPADLAWSLLMEATGQSDIATRLFQALKWRLVATWDRAGWSITRTALLAIIKDLSADAVASEQELRQRDRDTDDTDQGVIDLSL